MGIVTYVTPSSPSPHFWLDAGGRSEKKRRSDNGDPGEECELEAIIGGSDSSVPFSFLRTGAEVGMAVFRIIAKKEHHSLKGKLVPEGAARATGFVISAGGCVLTNRHVIPTAKFAADNLQAEFFYQDGERPETVDFREDGFFLSHALDFTVIQLKNLPERPVTPVPLPIQSLKELQLSANHKVNIIGHPKGKKKRVALQDNIVTTLRERAIDYTTDTEPGSSGSPVFNNKWELVALHQKRGKSQDAEGNYTHNCGLRIDSIVAILRASPEDLRQELGLP